MTKETTNLKKGLDYEMTKILFKYLHEVQDNVDEELTKLASQIGGCKLCGAVPMTANCNNANCS